MIRKVKVIILVGLLYLSSLVVIYNQDLFVKADQVENSEIDGLLIHKIAQELSEVVTKVYPKDELQKGRAFGTVGEHWTAEYLMWEMRDNLSLYDPTENSEIPYWEEIQDPYNKKLEILDRGLKINGTEPVSDLFIVPQWNRTGLDPLFKGCLSFLKYDTDKLTHNFTESGLKVYREPDTPWWDNILENQTLIESILNNESITNQSTFLNFLLPIFEEEYGFKFAELNETNAPDKIPWYNDTYAPICDSPYVFINETTSFNPNVPLPLWKNLTPPWSKFCRFFQGAKRILKSFFRSHFNCKGEVLYDFNNYTYDMFTIKNFVPTININKTIGEPIYQNPENYNITYWINQSWNEDITSYNVIGQINGTDKSKTIILCSFYDCWWNQGTADSAIGVGIVLAIAKHMKELETVDQIKPKYNVKFILFGGEEYGLRGAKSYESRHDEENITHVIDINQIGFNQTEPRQTLNIISNRFYLKYLTEEIGGRTDYVERLNNTTDFETWLVVGGGPSNDEVFAKNRSRFQKSSRPACNTTCFIKGYGWKKNWRWKLHHRDGENHSQGDVMNYYDEVDVNLTAEMVWNVTKCIAYGPYVWFDGDPTFTKYDSNNDGYFDSLNVSYTIDTSWPSERASVRLVLYPKFKWKHPGLPLLYRLREEKEYTLTQNGVSGYINATLPTNYPQGEYIAILYLCNSSGDAYLDAIHLIGLKTYIDGLEMVQHIEDVLGINILEKLKNLKDEILEHIGINILKLIERLKDFSDKRIRDIFLDILGYYIFRNDSCIYTDFEMHPPNTPPNAPDKPIDLGKDFIHYKYKTKTSDPDPGDKIRFQWNWNGKINKWILKNFNSNEYHIRKHRWWTKGSKTVKVRAKNPNNPNVFSDWSEELTVFINKDCSFNVATSQTSQNNINNPNIQNSYDSTVVVVDQYASYQGFSIGFQGTPDYEYDFSGISSSSEKDAQYNFSEIGAKYVNFTATLDTVAFYNETINVVNISTCFNINPLGAQPNQTIKFNDTTISKRNIVNWTWDFGDGNISYDQNTSHNYSQTGVYNVTLNVTDSNNEVATFWQIIHVESDPPEIITAPYYPVPGTLGCNITIYADFYDNNKSGIDSANVNISYPNGTTNNFTMYENENSSYEYVFNDTLQVGWYFYTIWVTDIANNTNNFAGNGFQMTPAFGNSIPGNQCKNIKNNISGSNFTVLVNGTAESISAYIQTNLTTAPKTKCMIYRVNDSKLMGTTEEKTLNTGVEADWVTYNFSTPKPNLTTNTSYILACWSNDTCNLSYDNASNISFGRYKNIAYGAPPSPNITWDDNESRLYSIYCTYSTTPEIISTSASPNVIGFGHNTTITAEVEHYYTLVENINVNITYPNSTTGNFSMTRIDDETFQYIFDNTWTVGQYNYSIWMEDKLGANSYSTDYSFNVSGQATVSVCTIKDEYGNNEIVNLTDPPGPPSQEIGYELFDDDSVLHIWNKYDSYYFDTDSGIQLTNHYNEYWSHNVLMLGYYDNDVWNLIYRTDELSGFNRNISSDNETFVNATLWKNLSYEGYDFRLAIRYHLGVDDTDLTVIPYIKNIDDEDIPYVLGFGWEVKDIKICGTSEYDYIRLYNNSNNSFEEYYLNQTLNKKYTNLSAPLYNETGNITDWADPMYEIIENLPSSGQKYLFLVWNKNLDYLVKVKNRTGQYNAPVTVFIKIGTLTVNQKKYTTLHWYDSRATYYFNDHSASDWAVPDNMDDGNENTYANSNAVDDLHRFNANSYTSGGSGNITKVELRTKAYRGALSTSATIRIWPKPNGTGNSYYDHNLTTTPTWYIDDITNCNNAPSQWTWDDINNLDCWVECESLVGMLPTMSCSKVEIRVTYNPLGISNPYPPDCSSNISISPVLNITVSNADGDNMDVTWSSNSSGSWQVFGTNNSVGNGTYHQIMSNASVNGKWWYWKVNVSSGTNYIESSVYKFYTGNQSKIENTGSTSIRGYLLMQVQFYNTSLGEWVVADDTVNETSLRVINSSEQLALDSIFNGNVNTSDLSLFGNGTYRVYAAFRDPDGNVLVCDDETEMITTYDFTVTF